MPGFLKKKRTWFGLLAVIILVVGFMMFQSASTAKKAELEKAAAAKVESPYAAIANGKVDVEGGIIQIAARPCSIGRGEVTRQGSERPGRRLAVRRRWGAGSSGWPTMGSCPSSGRRRWCCPG